MGQRQRSTIRIAGLVRSTEAPPRASRATLRLWDGDGHLRFEVIDDGVGFDTDETSYGTGLQGMIDRLAAVGGEPPCPIGAGDRHDGDRWYSARAGRLTPGCARHELARVATERAERLRLVFAQSPRPAAKGLPDRLIFPHEPCEVPKAVLHDLG